MTNDETETARRRRRARPCPRRAPRRPTQLNIAFTIHSSPSNTFWQAVKKGFDDACAKIQANCQMIFTQTEGSMPSSRRNMQAALAAKPDALITSIVDNNAFDDLIKGARDSRHHRHRHQCRRHRRRQGQCPPGLHRPGLHPGRLYARQGAVRDTSRRTARSRCWSASRRPARTGRSSAPPASSSSWRSTRPPIPAAR